MRKIKLELDTLAVESFVTADATPLRGTVHGNWGTYACDTINNTCDGAETCGGATCGVGQNTCALSCGDCGTYECSGEGSGVICQGGSGIGCGSSFC